MQGAGIITLLGQFVAGIAAIPALLIGGWLLIALISAVKRGSGV